MSYVGRKAALPTLHQKGSLIAPIFKEVNGLEVIEVNVDTDQFGTFSGEIERSKSALETAKAKARLAIEVTGLDVAIASEGSIGPDLEIPFVVSDVETLLYLDVKMDIEVDESFRSFDIFALSHTLSKKESLEEFLVRADFPQHQLIAKLRGKDGYRFEKGIKERGHLNSIIERFREIDPEGEITLENDLRAHASPSRQKNIKKVAELLARRVASRCPICNMSGFGRRGWRRGLACKDCGGFNEQGIHLEYLSCPSCGHETEGRTVNESLEARYCIFCNP